QPGRARSDDDDVTGVFRHGDLLLKHLGWLQTNEVVGPCQDGFGKCGIRIPPDGHRNSRGSAAGSFSSAVMKLHESGREPSRSLNPEWTAKPWVYCVFELRLCRSGSAASATTERASR